MASGKKTNPRRTKGRHRRQKPRPNDTYVNWLGAGAVTMGLGAAIATGQGIAAAQPGSDASSSASSGDAAGSDSESTAGSSSGLCRVRVAPKRVRHHQTMVAPPRRIPTPRWNPPTNRRHQWS
jgi:hypothetical protein